jgi:hypothetical protein
MDKKKKMDRQSGDEELFPGEQENAQAKRQMGLEDEVHGHEVVGGAGKNGGSFRHPSR